MKPITLIAVLLLAASTARAETLNIVGTGDGMRMLRDIARAYEARHPADRVIVPESIGSSGGIRAVGDDKNVLGRVARAIKDKEKPYGLSHVPYARIPVAFYRHSGGG